MVFKASIKRIICLALSAAMLSSLSVNAIAARYGTTAEVFNPNPYEREVENIDRLITDGFQKDEDNKEIERDYEIMRRTTASFTINSNTKLLENMSISVPKGRTLTVASGTVLTIYGRLIVEGKLVNNGTIILGGKEENRSDKDDKNLILITNSGTVDNNGTIDIVRGTFENKINAKLINDGTINIKTTVVDRTALRNVALTRKGETTFGEIENNGTINVSNTHGTGIYNFSKAVIRNNGEIYQDKKAVITGNIRGNKVVVK